MWQYMQTCNNQKTKFISGWPVPQTPPQKLQLMQTIQNPHKEGTTTTTTTTTTHADSTTYHTSIQNLSSVKFNNEEIKIMKLHFWKRTKILCYGTHHWHRKCNQTYGCKTSNGQNTGIQENKRKHGLKQKKYATQMIPTHNKANKK